MSEMNLADLPARWQAKIELTLTGCWSWTAFRQQDGYGVTTVDGKLRRAHRAIYERLVGPVLPELTLDHLCRNRACVNPAHLEPVTRGENVRRGIGAQLARDRFAQQKTCKHGHELVGDNVRTYMRQGYLCRRCLKCHVVNQRRHVARRGAQ